MELIIKALVDENYGVLESLSDITAVGHRVLHGGTKYRDCAIITEDVKDVIRHHIELGPLHNPANLIGISSGVSPIDVSTHSPLRVAETDEPPPR